MSVKSALRTLQIFEAFAATRAPMTLSELSRALGAPRSSCLALVGTLCERGYLYRLSGESGYYPTRRWLEQARAITETDPVALHVRAALERIRDATGETAIAAVLSGGRALYLDVVESGELIRFTARAGETKPVHVSASGRALLGALDVGQRPGAVQALVVLPGEPRARFSRKALLERVAEEAQRGWSVNLGEHRADVLSVAAGFVAHGLPHALVIAAPLGRAARRVERIGSLVLAEARALSEMVG
jgi:DNA-binding IclR family transcriptional regulator